MSDCRTSVWATYGGAEPEAGLAEVAVVEPQHRHLADVEAAREDEFVQPIGLDRAEHEADERLRSSIRCVSSISSRPGAHGDLVQRHHVAGTSKATGCSSTACRPSWPRIGTSSASVASELRR